MLLISFRKNSDSLVLETRKIIMAIKTVLFTKKRIIVGTSVTFRTVGLQTPNRDLISGTQEPQLVPALRHIPTS